MTALLERSDEMLRPWRFSLAMFERMLETGILPEDARVELLDGQIVELPEMKQNHANCIKRLYDVLQGIFSSRADVYAQSPIRLPQDGRPLPDVMMIQTSSAITESPLPEKIYLVIEVAGSSIYQDRSTKLELYARDNIIEYWILNLEEHQLEIYRDPKEETYQTKLILQIGQPATCLAFPDDAIDWFLGLEA
jgi:hypothetical protein